MQEQKLPKEPKAVSKFGQQWVASAELGLVCSPVLSHYPEAEEPGCWEEAEVGGDVTHSHSTDPEERQ